MAKKNKDPFDSIMGGILGLVGDAAVYVIGTLIRALSFSAVNAYHAWHNKPEPLDITLQTRFAHTHIVGGSGHGKTQLLQQLILADLYQMTGKPQATAQPAKDLLAPKTERRIIPFIYLLLCVGLVHPAPLVAAGIIIMLYAARDQVAGTIYASHIKNQAIIFWVNLIRFGVITILYANGYRGGSLGYIYVLFTVWTLYRIGMGLYRAIRLREYAAPSMPTPASQKAEAPQRRSIL